MASSDPLKPLTVREITFCHLYAETGNAKQSGLKAGYTSDGMGSKLLKDPRIKDHIDMLLREHCLALDITTHKILAGLYDEAVYKGDGSSHSARVSAWTTLAKTQGMLTDNVNHKGSVALTGTVTLYLPDNGRDKKES